MKRTPAQTPALAAPAGGPFTDTLLESILTYQASQDPAHPDPEICCLQHYANPVLFLCALSYPKGTVCSLHELRSRQQKSYEAIGALFAASDDSYEIISATTEGRLAALLLRRGGGPVTQEEIEAYLKKLLSPCFPELEAVNGKLLYAVADNYSELPHLYETLKSHVIFYDYAGYPDNRFVCPKRHVERSHMILWTRFEQQAEAICEAIMTFHSEDISDCFDQILQVLMQWLSPDMNRFLSDVQTFLDILQGKLAGYFGFNLLAAIDANKALFTANSLDGLRRNLYELGRDLYEHVHSSTRDATYLRAMQIRSYIQDNIRDYTLNVQNIAERFCLSPQLLSQQFRKCFGITPLHFIEQQRVKLIQAYLSDASVSMDEICQMTGVGSAATLNRMFVKHTGKTPSGYRRAITLTAGFQQNA